MWRNYFVPDMSERLNRLYVDIGGDPFVIRNPARTNALHKYSEEVRRWQGKALRMIYLMSRAEFQLMVLK